VQREWAADDHRPEHDGDQADIESRTAMMESSRPAAST
jgi:hypothetical protein